MRWPCYLAIASSLVACADAGDGLDTDNTEVSDVVSETAGELSVRTSATTMWVDRAIKRVGDAFVLHGRTSRTLTDGRAFINDDVYGDFARPSARTFQISWDVSTATTLTEGVDQFVGLNFVHSSNRPDHLTGRVVVTPRLSSFAGSSKIYLKAAVAPVVVAGVVVYRITGHTTLPNSAVRVTLGTDVVAAVHRLDSRAFEIDLAPDQVFALTAGGTIVIDATLASGSVHKAASMGLAVARLGLTSGDAYEVWPRPTCTTALVNCLTGLPDGAIDLASCGAAVRVKSCQGTVGVVVDDVAFVAALQDTDATLATATSHADAVALVGADHTEAFLFGAKQTVETRFEQLFGRWFLSATARTAAFTSARGDGLDAAYARPLGFVDGHEPVIGNAAAMRQVAADAVLRELSAMDFVHSELARSLDQLVSDFRAQHVADIGAFRTTIIAEPYPGTPEWDAHVGSWLGLYTEVVIERATGNVVRTLVEID